MVGEERVYDNRLLMSLIGKLGPLVLPAETDPATDRWQPLMDTVEQGLPEPVAAAPEDDGTGAEEDESGEMHIWEDEDLWWTDFPPPPDYDGLEQGKYGDDDYHRTLSTAELAVIRRDEAEELAERRAEAAEERNHYFGFNPNAPEGGAEGPQRLEDEEALFSPEGPEIYGTSEGAAAA